MKTFEQAKQAIFAHLSSIGWSVKVRSDQGVPLKIPHATSPSGDVRLWFKAQAVYFTIGRHAHQFGNARSVHMDIRKVTPEEFVKECISFAKL